MLERVFRRPRVRERMRANPLADVLEELVEHLVDRGHGLEIVQRYLQAAEHYGRWLGSRTDGVPRITKASTRSFMDEHLPVCRCKPPAPCHRNTVRAGLKHLLAVTSVDDGHEFDATDPHVALLKEFDQYMQDVRGLAPATRQYRVRYAREFLVQKYGHASSQWTALSADDVIEFVSRYGTRCSPATAQVAASSLRGFLRFLKVRGSIAVDLARAAPRVAHWRLAPLPSILTDKELRQLLRACDRRHSVGRRDHAVILCMMDLGLRAQEVAALRIDDIDWRRSTLRIHLPKQRRGRLVPMPARLAEALANYLRKGRPTPSGSRSLFVHHRAPVGAVLHPRGVSQIVLRAAARAGLQSSRIGTHRLRHTAASRMLGQGATLKQIADVLGHGSIDTTAIYAKVDLQMLAGAALPWPGQEVAS